MDKLKVSLFSLSLSRSLMDTLATIYKCIGTLIKQKCVSDRERERETKRESIRDEALRAALSSLSLSLTISLFSSRQCNAH